MRSTASQVRQDLNCFGGFGQQGYGYSVDGLKEEIKKILGLNNKYKTILIGAGSLSAAIVKHLDFEKLGYDKTILIGAGSLSAAIVKHLDFEKLGYDLIACFDNDEDKIGTKIGELTIKNDSEIDDFCAENKVEVVILCIPKENVENVLDKLYGLGIRNFWNFSHYDITSRYNDAVVENVHLNDSLMTLCYRISNS